MAPGRSREKGWGSWSISVLETQTRSLTVILNISEKGRQHRRKKRHCVQREDRMEGISGTESVKTWPSEWLEEGSRWESGRYHAGCERRLWKFFPTITVDF